MKRAAIGFSSVAFSLTLLLAGVVAAQSAPPRKDIPAIAKAANGAIVSIVMSDKDGKPIAQGTGFVISKDGHIVTNYHVISEGSSAIVKFPDGAFYVVDGVLAFDKARDVAIIKAHGENFRTLTLGNSDQLQIGEEVVAIGNPLSLESTVSNGIVSGIRTVPEEGGKFLQVTAPISHGSSGGPLFNMAGEVIGITSAFFAEGENLNFAIPINDAKRLLLANSSEVRALPNELEPVKTQTRVDAPSPVASPPVQPPVEHEHAATAEQCEADARTWISRPDGFVKQLPYTELQIRALEMGDCYVVGARDEPTVRKNVRYVAVSNLYDGEMIMRMVRYIGHHDLEISITYERVPVLSITQWPPKNGPSQKQCKADLLLWTQQNQEGMVDKLSANDIFARRSEMVNCAIDIHGTDFSAAATFGGYFSMEDVYNATMIEQLHAYLLRHNEWNQFVSEDSAGGR